METSEINNEIDSLLNRASELADNHIEQLARNVLKSKKLREFVMAMGGYFFTDSKDNIIYTNDLSSDAAKELDDFINQWDRELKVTGSPMRFTRTGPKITDWGGRPRLTPPC